MGWATKYKSHGISIKLLMLKTCWIPYFESPFGSHYDECRICQAEFVEQPLCQFLPVRSTEFFLNGAAVVNGRWQDWWDLAGFLAGFYGIQWNISNCMWPFIHQKSSNMDNLASCESSTKKGDDISRYFQDKSSNQFWGIFQQAMFDDTWTSRVRCFV